MLITLMLVMALAAMALLAILPEISQQIKRDQEEELRHRGSSYIRAIQHFYKKFGRYPTRIEDLENTNKMRFLRKRYKDPMSRDPETGKEKDFKLLHMQDVALNNGPMLPMMGGGGGQVQGGAPGVAIPQAGLGGPGGVQGALGAMQQMGGLQAQVAGGPQMSGGPQVVAGNDEAEPGDATNPTSNSNSKSPSPSPLSPSPGSSGASGGSGFNGPVFGGGPILGVASTSKAKTIREFNKKNHYNDWLFIYDPTSDRGGLLVGPWQPLAVQGNIAGATPIGQPGQSGQGQGLGGILQPVGPQGQNPTQQQNPMGQPPQNPEQ